jgi:adenylate cyclase class 2
MSGNEGQELEVKFYLSDLSAFQEGLEISGGHVLQARLHEVNLRFDTPDSELTRTYQVLRLRQDKIARLTYKGPGEVVGGVRSRREIEFSVGDFSEARSFLEALGYQVSLMYEKFRATYELDGVEVTLDEMPYGTFAELEGPDAASIQTLAGKLGVQWEARIVESYTFLFERLRGVLGFTFRDLSFENFAGIEVTPEALQVRPADQK